MLRSTAVNVAANARMDDDSCNQNFARPLLPAVCPPRLVLHGLFYTGTVAFCGLGALASKLRDESCLERRETANIADCLVAAYDGVFRAW